MLLKGNLYPNEPVGSYPWWTWVAAGLFVLFWFFWYFIRPRLRR